MYYIGRGKKNGEFKQIHRTLIDTQDIKYQSHVTFQHLLPSISDYNLSYTLPQAIAWVWARGSLFGKVQVVVQPLAGGHAGDVKARGTIGQRGIEYEAPDGGGQDDKGSDPARDERLAAHALLGSDEAAQAADRPGLGLACGVIDRGQGSAGIKRLQVENEFNQCTTHHGGGQMGGQVMVQEALTAHQPEGEVVRSPAQEQKSGAVVQT